MNFKEIKIESNKAFFSSRNTIKYDLTNQNIILNWIELLNIEIKTKYELLNEGVYTSSEIIRVTTG